MDEAITKSPKVVVMGSGIDVDKKSRTDLVKSLNVTLGTGYDLYTQVKQAHWNVKGARFFALHKFFDELAAHALVWSDDVAERASALGGQVLGTVREMSKSSLLPEYDLRALDGETHISLLAERYAIFARHLRDMIETAESDDDPITVDMLTRITGEAEKDLWMLESHRDPSRN